MPGWELPKLRPESWAEARELGKGQSINTLCVPVRSSGFILGDEFSSRE